MEGAIAATNSSPESRDASNERASRLSASAEPSDPSQPAYPLTSVRDRTSPRFWWKVARARAAPNESPTRWARSIRSSRRSPTRQAAYASMPNSSGGSVDPPEPGASQAITVNSPERSSIWLLQVAWASPTKPCVRTTGAPVPARSNAMLNPPTSIRVTGRLPARPASRATARRRVARTTRQPIPCAACTRATAACRYSPCPRTARPSASPPCRQPPASQSSSPSPRGNTRFGLRLAEEHRSPSDPVGIGCVERVNCGRMSRRARCVRVTGSGGIRDPVRPHMGAVG